MSKTIQNNVIILLTVAISIFMFTNQKRYMSCVVTLLITGYLTFANWNILIRIIKTIPRDAKIIKGFITYYTKIKILNLLGYDTFAKIFKTLVTKHPNKIAFIHEDSSWTYQKVEDYSNQIANYFKHRGYKRGDTVSLLMESCPEYVCIWLGLSKIGVVVALTNNNLRADTLLHSIKISKCTGIIIGKEQEKALADLYTETNEIQMEVYMMTRRLDDECNSIIKTAVSLDKELVSMSSESPEEDIRRGSCTDEMLYIYTSGTTGLPKAAIMTQSRAMLIGMGPIYVAGIYEHDIVYTPLPLYHTAGGVLGVSSVLLGGSTCVIRSKFSASKYWTDCIKHKCTVAQYIGEMCRYCLAAPASDSDKCHQVRMILGNGLRPQIWEEFVKRFNIKQVVEFYGATEGNANMMNIANKVGSIGFIPLIAQPFYPLNLLRIDPITNEPIRGKDNLCIKCKVGEPGLLVSKIRKSTLNSFTGYVEKSATEKKMIRDVFQKGDCVFNSGDVLIRDEYNFFYFKDRTGDTFRWKGENVSTTEVEAAISNIIKQQDCIVYGVEVPNTEGKAGMAAIVDQTGELDLDKLIIGINKSLPVYARPIFLRIIKTSISLTGTFKLKKTDLQNDSYDFQKTAGDSLYINDGNKYVPLTQELYDQILKGTRRL
ncbi:long-chain fatty acid transport protein 4-like [Adelges cooleyi]|uniref:long-chain fatty acid transport protein 4-like n=1 Tax=Adelges cooleyi TaxID=133065 RepID=UPI00217F31A7|nr:long-chain fatty acid transport protein 4-like [Adelges cooleyi]XP_050433650.1 long-chain fatty acid transport protein 4-like [Adelges cooleyi]